jgi:inhibitor of cysteine peptidase
MTRKLSVADNGSTITLDSGDNFEIALAENPTTGYRWHVDVSPAKVVTSEGSDLDVQGKGVGAGGERRLQFHAAQAGSFTIECLRYRSGESPSSAVETFKISGVVR